MATGDPALQRVELSVGDATMALPPAGVRDAIATLAGCFPGSRCAGQGTAAYVRRWLTRGSDKHLAGCPATSTPSEVLQGKSRLGRRPPPGKTESLRAAGSPRPRGDGA